MATGRRRAYRDGVPTAAPLTAADLDRRLAAHRRAAAVAGIVRRLAVPLAVAGFAAGGLVLFVRLTDAPAEPAAWGGLSALIAACGFACAPFHRVPNPGTTAAEIDTALRSGGLLMTLADRPAADRPADWLARLEPRRDRWADARPRVPVGRLLKAVWLPALFLTLAATVPVEEPAEERFVDRSVAGDRLTDELRETFAALAADGAANPAALAGVGAEVESLAAAIGENGPTAGQLEAADALRDRLLGAAATLAGEDGADPARFGETLAAGADLLAGSGLLESEPVRDAAAKLAGGAGGGGVLASLGELAGGDAGQFAVAAEALAGSLSAEDRAKLAAAGVRLMAGGDPAEVVDSLPPGVLNGVFEQLGERDPELLARLTGAAAGTGPVPPDGFALPSPPPALAAAAGLLPPGVRAAGGFAGDLLAGRMPYLDRLTAGTTSLPPSAPARTGRIERAAVPSRKVAAGRPVPPRLRGVVSRYFAGNTTADPAAAE